MLYKKKSYLYLADEERVQEVKWLAQWLPADKG